MSEATGFMENQALESLARPESFTRMPTSSRRTNGGTATVVRRLSFSTTSIRVEFV